MEGAPKKLFGASRPPPKEEFADKILGFSDPPQWEESPMHGSGVCRTPPWRERPSMALSWASGPSPWRGKPLKKFLRRFAPPLVRGAADKFSFGAVDPHSLAWSVFAATWTP